MASSALSAGVQYRAVLLGVAQVLFGCLVGFVPPTAVPHFRSIVAAHIEFCMNGMLQAVVGFAVPMMALPSGALLAMEALLLVGTWANGAALLSVAFTGVSSPLMPTINASHPPKEISPHSLCHNLLLTCAVTIAAALALAVVGLARGMGARRAAAAGKAE